MKNLTPEEVTSIRTCSQLNTPVYFYFEGDLFEYNNFTHTTEKISSFIGFNCAVRKGTALVDSFEYVKFSLKDIDAIYNEQVKFDMPYAQAISYAGTLVFDFSFPVNRENYTALEHFTFSCIDSTNLLDSNHFETKLGWTRFSDPKRKTYVEPQQDKWIYTAKGYKCPGKTYFEDKFAEFDFVGNEEKLLNR